jgi:hypothetical protein
MSGSAIDIDFLRFIFGNVANFFIDLIKNYVWRVKPEWVIGPYIIDQFTHYISIAWVAVLIQREFGLANSDLTNMTTILLIGFLIVTYIWSISERIFYHANADYQTELRAHFWARMLFRAALLSGLLLVTNLGPTLAAATLAAPRLPYFNGQYRCRALVTDLVVAMFGLIFIYLAKFAIQ